MQDPHLYVIIIGSEILNGRREDKHATFIKGLLSERSYVPYCIEIISDDKALIKSSFSRVLADKKAMLFSFGGIGSTPDDLTRAIAAEVFTQSALVRHKAFEHDIMTRFGEKAHPNRIHMADLPENAGLLHNPVNNMSGFYLQDRYFFVPGFPEMAHPMIREAVSRFLPQNKVLYRLTFIAHCSEDKFIFLMKEVPDAIACSSLPMFVEGKPRAEISLASFDEMLNHEHFKEFLNFLEREEIIYEVINS